MEAEVKKVFEIKKAKIKSIVLVKNSKCSTGGQFVIIKPNPNR